MTKPQEKALRLLVAAGEVVSARRTKLNSRAAESLVKMGYARRAKWSGQAGSPGTYIVTQAGRDWVETRSEITRLEGETWEWSIAFNYTLALLAFTADERYSALMGNKTPRGQRDFERLCNPQVGDLVVELSSLNRALGWEDWDHLHKAVGVCVAIREDAHYGPQYDVCSIYPGPWTTTWSNSRFIVIEDCPPLPVCPHCKGEDPDNCPKKRFPYHPDNAKNGYCAGGRWCYPMVMTKESLTGALADRGIEVKP